MSKKPVISIVIPIYNVEKYLERCLGSLQNQSFTDWEAICVNDGSKDNSLQILQTFAQKDERFVVINQNNTGLAQARNNALQKVRGQYLMFVDSDDYIHPQTLEFAVAAMNSAKADLGCFRFKNVPADVDVDFTTYDKLTYSFHADPINSVLQKKVKYSAVVWNKIYRMEMVKDLNFVNISPCEDNIYSFAALCRAKSLVALRYPFYQYVCNQKSVMNTLVTEKKQNARLVMLKHFNLIAATYDLSAKDRKIVYEYINNRVVFREYIAEAVKKATDIQQVKDAFLLVKNFEKEGLFQPQYLSLKAKAIWALSATGNYKFVYALRKFI